MSNHMTDVLYELARIHDAQQAALTRRLMREHERTQGALTRKLLRAHMEAIARSPIGRFPRRDAAIRAAWRYGA